MPNGHGGNRNGAGRPVGKVNKRVDRVTGEERIEVALDAVLAAIDNMAEEAKTTRLTARQLAVISRKLEYDSTVRFYTRRDYLSGKPGRPWEPDATDRAITRRNGAVSQPEPRP